MAGTYYFISSGRYAVAYDFDDSNNLTIAPSKHRNLQSIIPVISNGATATANRIGILGRVSGRAKIFVFNRGWNRMADEDVNLNSGDTYNSLCATDDRWVATNSTRNRLEFWTFAGVEQTDERDTLESGVELGSFTDGTHIYIVNDGQNNVKRRTYSITTLSTFISNLGAGLWRGGTSTSSRFLILNTQSGGRAVFYNHSGVLQSSEQQNINTNQIVDGLRVSVGGYGSVLALEDIKATITISSDDTDIRAGKSTTIDIDSDIDVTGLTATDITVTNGTRGSLTGSGKDYSLAVTAGSAGTMTVAIGEDAVSPGNAAVSKDFNVKLALPSVPPSVTATVIDHNRLRLRFGASTGTVERYRYKIATSLAGLATAPWIDAGTSRDITIGSLSPSTLYYLQVRSENNDGNSAASSAVSATTSAAPIPAPGTPASLSATAVDHDTIKVVIGASTGTVTQRQIRYSTSTSGLASATWQNVASTTVDVDGLSPSTLYYFQARAGNQGVYSGVSTTASATTQVAPTIIGTYHFVQDSGNTIAYDFDKNNNTTRNSSKDRNLNQLTGATRVLGAVATRNRIAILDSGTTKSIRILNRDFTRVSGEDVTLSNQLYTAICATNDRWVVSRLGSPWQLEFWDFSGTEQVSERQTPGTSGNNGLISDGTYIYVISNISDNVRRRTYDDTTLTSFISDLGSGSWNGGAATSKRFVFVNDAGDAASFSNHSGVIQSSEAISLPSGTYVSVFAVEEITRAAITITTDDTDVRAGESVDFKIASNIDITGLEAGDVTVTNGTRGALTRTDAQNYTLRVTAGSAGKLTLAIGEDAVSPGNNAVSTEFTINARISASIAFDKTTFQNSETARVTVKLSETPDSNLPSGRLTASAGTLTGFSGSGRTYTATLTAPASGSGTITVEVAGDSVSAGGVGNFRVTGSIPYTALPPPPPPAPGVPASLVATAVDHDTIRLVIGASTGTVTQRQYRYSTSEAGLSSATWNNAVSATVEVDSLSPNTLYYFQARAGNQGEFSSESSTASARTDTLIVAPGTPASLSITVIDHDTVRLVIGASSGTVTNLQYRYSTSEAGLLTAAWQDGGTSNIILVGNLIPNTLYYFQARAENQGKFSSASATSSATTDVQTTGDLSIEDISDPLNILINTDFELLVKITGEPAHVLVEGDLRFFDYEFIGSVLRMWVNFKEQFFEQTLTITAVDKDDSNIKVTKTVTYNVVLPAPIIPDIKLPPIVKGSPYRAFIPIKNKGSTRVSGLFNGTGYTSHQIGDEKGVLILGDPSDVERTVESGTLTVRDESDGHVATRDLTYPIEDVSYDKLYIYSSTDRTIYSIDKNAGISDSNTTTINPEPELVIDNIPESVSLNPKFVVVKNELWLVHEELPNIIRSISKTSKDFILLQTSYYDPPPINIADLTGEEVIPPDILSIGSFDDIILFLLQSPTNQAIVSYGVDVDLIENEQVFESLSNIPDDDTNRNVNGLRFQRVNNFGQTVNIGVFDISLDETYVYGLVPEDRLEIHRWRRSDRSYMGYMSLSEILRILSYISVDDTYFYILNGRTGLIERYLKSTFRADGGTRPIVGAMIGPPAGKSINGIAVTSEAS